VRSCGGRIVAASAGADAVDAGCVPASCFIDECLSFSVVKFKTESVSQIFMRSKKSNRHCQPKRSRPALFFG